MAHRIYFALILFCLFSGCKKEEELVGFEMTYREDFSIQAGLGTFVIHHFTFDSRNTRFQQYLQTFGKEASEIKAILPQSFAITGVFGDADLEFVENVTLEIYKETDPNGEVEVAYRYPVPINPGNQIALIPNLPDVKNIMSSNRVGFDLAMRFRNTTTEETTLRMDITFKATY